MAVDFVADLKKLKLDDMDRYSDFLDYYHEVSAALVGIDRTQCRATVIRDQLQYNAEEYDLLEEKPRADLEEVRDTLDVLEEIDALREYRSFIPRRYESDKFDEETYGRVEESVEIVESGPVPELEKWKRHSERQRRKDEFRDRREPDRY